MKKKSKIRKFLENFDEDKMEIHITDKEITVLGTDTAVLTGPATLVTGIKKSNVDEKLIKIAVKLGLGEDKDIKKALKSKDFSIFDLDID